LGASDQRVYVALRRTMGRTNNGDLSLPLSRARHYGITSPTTLAKSLRALVAVGLAAVTRRGGCQRGGQRLATLYRVTDEAVYELPAKFIDASAATNDWLAIESIAQARALIREAEQAARDATAKQKPMSKNWSGTSPRNGLVKPKTTPNFDSRSPGPLQEMDLAESAEEQALPRPAAELSESDLQPIHSPKTGLLCITTEGRGEPAAARPAWTRTGELRPHTFSDGKKAMLTVWSRLCATCGEPFEQAAPVLVLPGHAPSRFGGHCAKHPVSDVAPPANADPVFKPLAAFVRRQTRRAQPA
jgi:hypothetical protein